ncbi:MAG: hypothetical protein IT376_00530 [Polyangiaceae bacterium]|nr:hypothetical protein [Polyangiaceae bacterium]
MALRSWCWLPLGAALVAWPGAAQAAGKAVRPRPAERGASRPPAKEAPAAAPEAPPAPPAGASAAPASPPAPAPGTPKAEVTEEKGGVKTYRFGPQDVEGRTKSPQIAYFLRRVRAEFDAGDLGHRSFLRELAHTRHHPALR